MPQDPIRTKVTFSCDGFLLGITVGAYDDRARPPQKGCSSLAGQATQGSTLYPKQGAPR